MIGSASDLFSYLAGGIEASTCGVHKCACGFARSRIDISLHTNRSPVRYARALPPPRTPDAPKALSIHVIDGEGCGVARPRLAWQVSDFGLKRVVPGWSDAARTVFFLRAQQGVAVVDWARSVALVWLPGIDAQPQYEYAAPFRWLFDILAQRMGLASVHAAMLGRGTSGVLIAGKGGSGKSTLALSAAASGLAYVADDYCLVEPAETLRAHALFTTGKWVPGGRLKPLVPDAAVVESPIAVDDKMLVFLAETPGVRLPGSLALNGIVLPEIAPVEEARIRPATASDAFASLAPSTLAQSEASQGDLFGQLAALTRRLPAYHLQMPPCPERSVAALSTLIDDLATAKALTA